MRVGVVTIVHHPQDARILYRQIASLRRAGHDVEYVAPFTATGVSAPPGVRAHDVPRAAGRRRLRAWWKTRRLVRRLRSSIDLLVLHDPELVVALALSRRPPTVWDVHEDTTAALVDKSWLPRAMRGAAAIVTHAIERFAESRMHVILADAGYRDLFEREHPVVPNETLVPDAVMPPGDDRVVYLGRISRNRGAATLLALPELLPKSVTLHLLGPADAQIEDSLRAAHERGDLVWHGLVPNDRALDMIEGALCGLNLVRDLPNYRDSRQTKVYEYMARGVPVVATPVPVARNTVESHRCGFVVGFDDPHGVAAAVERLRVDPALRHAMGRRGHVVAREEFDWNRSGEEFVHLLERWAAEA